MQARSSSDVHPLVQITIGLVIGLVGFGLPYACSGTLQLTPVNECRLHALDVLPKDVNMLTVYDAIDIYERVRSCERGADGGP